MNTRGRPSLIISAEAIAAILRTVGEDVYVSYRHEYPQAHNEGYNALRWRGETHGKWDEVPLEHLIGQDIPVADNGFVVLSCFPGGFACVGPDGEFLGMHKELS